MQLAQFNLHEEFQLILEGHNSSSMRISRQTRGSKETENYAMGIQASRVSRFRFLGNALWDRRSRKVSTNSRIYAIYCMNIRFSFASVCL